jgi:lysophospholipase L1-like esterase
VRILLLTDSLSLPRAHKEDIVNWEDIYPNLLRRALPENEFIHVGIGGATITELLRQQNYYSLVLPDLVILHCGIVDCAPRALSQLEQEVIKHFHLVRLFKPFISSLRKCRGTTYTKSHKFEEALIEFKTKFPGKPIASIGILPGTHEYEKLAPGIIRNIVLYNRILSKHTIYIDNSDFPHEGILADHHHLSATGHKIIFERIKQLLSSFS